MGKLAAATIVAVASAQNKKVPPRHPLQRLTKLNKFAAEWCNANLDEKAAANWEGKFDRNTARFERRFELCGYYDETHEHGGPRERREDDDLAFLDCEGAACPRYDKPNPWYPTNHKRFLQVGSTIRFRLQTSTSKTSCQIKQMVRSIDCQARS